MDRFDVIEYRAARSMDQADYFWKHRLKKIPAARMDIAPKGIMPRLRATLDRIRLRESL